MKIGPRYKRARRLGADLFEKTQTQKYAMRTAAKGGKTARGKGGPRSGFGKSDFGVQLREKQRARFLYGIGERQFARYAAKAIAKRAAPAEKLFTALEMRLDNALYRLGIAPTRQAARQLAAHGHFVVNGQRITIPSYCLSVGDVIRVRNGSVSKQPLLNLADKIRDRQTPPWLSFDAIKGEATVAAVPKLVRTELPFDIATILQFYSR